MQANRNIHGSVHIRCQFCRIHTCYDDGVVVGLRGSLALRCVMWSAKCRVFRARGPVPIFILLSAVCVSQKLVRTPLVMHVWAYVNAGRRNGCSMCVKRGLRLATFFCCMSARIGGECGRQIFYTKVVSIQASVATRLCCARHVRVSVCICVLCVARCLGR